MYKDNYLTTDPPKDDSKLIWPREDASEVIGLIIIRLLLQIQNSNDSEVIGLINHYEFIKELMEYLNFLYSSKRNFSYAYEVYKAFYWTNKQNKISLLELNLWISRKLM